MLCAPLNWQYTELPSSVSMQSCVLYWYVRCGSSNNNKKFKKWGTKQIVLYNSSVYLSTKLMLIDAHYDGLCL